MPCCPGRRADELHAALLAAFNPATLKQLAFLKLGQRLENIAGGPTHTAVVQSLIEWAEERERTGDLADKALAMNGTAALRAFDRGYRARRLYAAEPTADLPAPLALEALPFDGEDARLPLAFLQRAIEAGKSVARLQVPRLFDGVADGTHMCGTAWILEPGLLITNHHVIDARDLRVEPSARVTDFRAQATGILAWFDYHQEGGSRTECAGADLVAQDRALDYAILKLREPHAVMGRPPLSLVPAPPTLGQSTRLNIVQHAKGGPQQYAIRNNFHVETLEGRFLRYLTDTEPGASGSPVLDDRFQVVALHHAAREVEPSKGPQSTLDLARTSVARFHNEGIAIHAILEHLAAATVDETRALGRRLQARARGEAA